MTIMPHDPHAIKIFKVLLSIILIFQSICKKKTRNRANFCIFKESPIKSSRASVEGFFRQARKSARSRSIATSRALWRSMTEKDPAEVRRDLFGVPIAAKKEGSAQCLPFCYLFMKLFFMCPFARKRGIGRIASGMSTPRHWSPSRSCCPAYARR